MKLTVTAKLNDGAAVSHEFVLRDLPPDLAEHYSIRIRRNPAWALRLPDGTYLMIQGLPGYVPGPRRRGRPPAEPKD